MESFVNMSTVNPSQRKYITHGYISHDDWPRCDYDYSDWMSLEHFVIIGPETINRELVYSCTFKFPRSIRVTNIYGLETTYGKDGSISIRYNESVYDMFE